MCFLVIQKPWQVLAGAAFGRGWSRLPCSQRMVWGRCTSPKVGPRDRGGASFFVFLLGGVPELSW